MKGISEGLFMKAQKCEHKKSSSDKSEELLNIFSYEFRSYYLTYLPSFS